MRLLSDEPLGFVEITPPRSRIVIFKGKEIRVTRELPLGEEDKDPQSSSLAKDIYRTLLFYTESYPNEKVTKLVMAGNNITSEIINDLQRKTGADISSFAPEALFKGIEDGTKVYPGCLGLALIDPKHFPFQFTPFSIQEKRKLNKLAIRFSLIFFGTLICFGLVILRLSLDLRKLTAFQGGIKGEIKMKEERMRGLALELVSHSIESSQPRWSAILMELAAVAPSGVHFKSMTIKKTKNGWTGEVQGVADGEEEIASLILMEELQHNFLKSPFFTGTKLVEKKLEGKKITFKITYQLKG